MFNKKNTKHLLTLKNNNEKIIEKLKSNNLKIDVGNDYIGLKN
jgi:hypothetical protein